MASRSSVPVDRANVPGTARPRRTILQIVAPGDVGGLESVVLALTAGQTHRGHNVIVAVVSHPRVGEHPFVAALTAAGVRTVHFVLPPRAYLKERALIEELCDREKPDVVHTHGYRPDILHAASRLRRSFATVTTLHGSSRVGGSSRFHEMLQMVMLRRLDAVIAVSRQLAEQLRGTWVRSERLHVIPNGWNDRTPIADRMEARRHLNLPEKGTVIGWVGRLIPIKGADVFLRSVKELAELPLTISLIGDGSERERLEEFVRANGLSDRVRFHGTVRDAARYISAFDMFVLSSRSEGTPVTLLEAIAARVPVVATTVGGVPDVVGPAEAMLVPPEDPGSLAEAIRHVVKDPEAAARRAEAAAHRLHANFSMERWVDAHDQVYDTIAVN
ncbi:MAG: YqgM-like family glycosyltransferase [Gemmatimonadales bacterium]|nr:YqgM-like family glycosyltransferase [Gemmatimonadales bacterium]